MSSIDKQIVKFIKRVRRRLTEQSVIRYSGYGIVSGLTLAMIFSVIALFIAWYYAPLYAVGAVWVGLIAGIVIGNIKRPNMREAALRLDSHGFHERLITSYELSGKEDTFSMIQKQDTLRRIGMFQIRKTFPLKPRWQMLLMIFVLMTAFVGITMIPTKAKEQAEAHQEVVKQIKDEIAKVDKTIERVQKIDSLSDEEKQNLIASLNSAKEELNTVNDAKELEKAKERISVIANQNADQMDNRQAREEIRSLAEAMATREMTQSQKLAQQLSDLQKDIANLDENTSDEDRQAIADQLQKLGEQTGNQTMQDAAKNLAQNGIPKDGLVPLQQAISNEQQVAQSQGQMASNSNNGQQNGQSGQQNGQQNSQQNGQNSQQNGQNGQQNGQSGQQNGQSGQQNGQSGRQNGQNGQSGQQNGQNGQQNGQSGQQNGQSGQQNGQSGQQNGQSGQQNGQNGQQNGQSNGYNTGSNVGTETPNQGTGSMVTIPNMLTQDNEALDGKINSNGESIEQKGGQAWRGDSVNYQQVIGDYSNNAYNKVDNSNYPKGVQDIVKSYFDDLNK